MGGCDCHTYTVRVLLDHEHVRHQQLGSKCSKGTFRHRDTPVWPLQIPSLYYLRLALSLWDNPSLSYYCVLAYTGILR